MKVIITIDLDKVRTVKNRTHESEAEILARALECTSVAIAAAHSPSDMEDAVYYKDYFIGEVTVVDDTPEDDND